MIMNNFMNLFESLESDISGIEHGITHLENELLFLCIHLSNLKKILLNGQGRNE